MTQRLVGARTFVSLRKYRNYRLYFFGQVVSISGTWMQTLAQAWLILSMTHSALAVGILPLCQFGPYAVLGLFTGVLADRLDQRRLLLRTQSAFALTAAILAVVVVTGVAQPWVIYLLATITGCITVLDTPARQSFVFAMVGPNELPNAIALNTTLMNGSRIVGPAIAGPVIAAAGVAMCFLINSLSFLAVIGALLLMRQKELYTVMKDDSLQNVLRRLTQGLTYTMRVPILRSVVLMLLCISTLSINFNVLLPILASTTLRAGITTFGILSATFGSGALSGALFVASLPRISWRVMFVGAMIFSVAELALAPLRVVWAAAGVLFIIGFAFSIYMAASNAVLQLHTPNSLRGRVVGVYSYVYFGIGPLGGLVAGWLAQVGGTQLAFVVAASVGLATACFGGSREPRHSGRAEQGTVPHGDGQQGLEPNQP